jgi:trehalose-6-phosphatase
MLPLYVGDDVTDEDTLRALSGQPIGILAADRADPEVAGQTTTTEYLVSNTQDVENLLKALAR